MENCETLPSISVLLSYSLLLNWAWFALAINRNVVERGITNHETIFDTVLFDWLHPDFKINTHRSAADFGTFAVTTYNVADSNGFFKGDA